MTLFDPAGKPCLRSRLGWFVYLGHWVCADDSCDCATFAEHPEWVALWRRIRARS